MQIKVSDLRFYGHSDNLGFSEISEFVGEFRVPSYRFGPYNGPYA